MHSPDFKGVTCACEKKWPIFEEMAIDISNIWVYVQTEERTHEQVNIYGPRLKRGKKYVL